MQRTEVDGGLRPGTTTDDATRLVELEREVKELRRANAHPAQRVGFLRGGARPPTEQLITFIYENKDEFGVEPICRELPIAPQTYYTAQDRPPSARSIRDEETVVKIRAVHKANYGVYGFRKVHARLRRDGHPVARCTVERLMRREGLRGISRRKGPRTTIPGPFTHRPGDLVDRRFTTPAPDCLWVADITYIRTFSRWVYAAFVLDVFSRRIVGWQLSTSLHTELTLDALEMGIWTGGRAGRDLSQLIHHSDYAEDDVKPRNGAVAAISRGTPLTFSA